MTAFHNTPMRLFGIATVLALVLAAGAIVWWLSAGELGAQGTTDDGNDAEVLAAALAVTTHSSALVSDNSAATNLSMNRETLRQSATSFAGHRTALAEQLEVLDGKGYDDRVGRIEILVNRLVSNTEQLLRERVPLLQALVQSSQDQRKLLTSGRLQVDAAATSVDSQRYDLMGDEIKWTYQDDVRRYAHLVEVEGNGPALMTLLATSLRLQDPRFVALAYEGSLARINRIQKSIEYLSENPGPALHPDLVMLSEDLTNIGDEGFFESLESRLRLIAAENALLADNRTTLELLLAEIDSLSAVVQGQTPPPAPTLPTDDIGVPGVSGDEIHFGQSAALTGPSAALGTGMRLGLQAAFEEANRAGGVHGRQLKLTTLDDGYDPQFAFENTLRLIGVDRVFGLIGAVGTPTSLSSSPVANAAGAPFVGPFTGANFLRDSELDNVVNYRASYYQETEQMVERLTEDLDVTRVAVLHQNDSYGLDGLEGVTQALARRDLEPVASGYYRRNTSAIKTAAFQIAEANPEAVIIIGAYEPAAAAIELLREELDPDPVFIAVSFVGSEALADELGSRGAGVYVTQVTPLPDDQSSSAVSNYRAALSAVDSDAEPGFVSLEGYLAGRLAIAGLEACGADLSRECFLDALQEAQAINIDNIRLQFGEGDNQGSDEVTLTVLGADGNYSEVERLRRTAR